MRGTSAIRRPLIVLAVCAVAALRYMARDFLIPTAGAVILALMLTPVANTFERLHLPPTPAALASVLLLTAGLATLFAISIPALTNWVNEAPMVTYTLERKLEGVRKSIAVVQEVSKQVEQAATASPSGSSTPPAEKVVVRDRSLLSDIASTTPGVLLQILYAGVLVFLLLAYRNGARRQIMRVPAAFCTRVRLARVMRDVNERAVPLLILISTIAAHPPSLRWFEVLLSDDRPVSGRTAHKPSLASVTRPPVRTRPRVIRGGG